MVLKYFLALGMTASLIGHSFISYAQLPVDPSIVHGGAVFDTVGNHMTIINSPNTILDWQNFSIGADSSVYFQQQDAASMVLNRVTGNDPSHIFGSLGSNGHIWLINPYGVLFGEHARIDAAGLMASTMDIANIDFLAKRYHFNSTSITGEVRNQGEIRTSLGGRVWLIGDRVQNDGLVQTPSGQTVIAAGKSVEFVDSGAPNVVVRVKAPENEVVNLGSLVASSGQVDLHGSIVNQQGIVRANSVGTDETGRIVLKADQATLAKNSQIQADQGTVHMEVSSTLNNWGAISGKDIALNASEILQQGQIIAQGGNVALIAQTSTYLDGTVDVSNAQGTGGNIRLSTNKLEGMAGGVLRADGKQGGHIRIEGNGSIAFSSTLAATGHTHGGAIEVTGDRVYLLNADIDASGGTQGGTVHLGGGWQGNGDLPHAREVLVGVGSEVKANGGTGLGAKGGEIAVWSTQSSEHYGLLQAKDGGRIEFSSQGVIKQTGDIQAGIGGMVLFDPKNLIITDNPPDNVKLASTIASGSFPDIVLSNGDRFGSAIALDGDRLAIGAEGRNTVYLFTGVGDNFSGLSFQKVIASETGADKMVPLPNNFFGTALALDGDLLVVGANRHALFTGAVYLFTGVSDNFSGLTYSKSITSGSGAIKMPSFFAESFGKSVALDSGRLAVGASNHEDTGGVYLFTGASGDFSELTFNKIVGNGKGAKNMAPLPDEGFFGNSIALEGNRLVVGATDWRSTSTQKIGTGFGALYLFTDDVLDDFSNLTFQKVLNPSEANAGNDTAFGMSVALNGNQLVVGEIWSNNFAGAIHIFNMKQDFSGWTFQKRLDGGIQGDLFGWSAALDGDRMAVGAIFNDGGGDFGNNIGAAYLYTGLSSVGGIDLGDATFSANPSSTSYITPANITGALNAGSDVVLQANNDLTVRSAINVNAGGSASGKLTLQAGRNITFNANVTTDNGNLTAIAGDSDADQNNRDSGPPTLTIAENVTLNVGLGAARLAAVNGNFINNNGDAAISDREAGRWLIYAANPATSTEGFSRANYSKLYNQIFNKSDDPDVSGILFNYSIAPILRVSAPTNPATLTYGDVYPQNIILTPEQKTALITGFIDDDTVDIVQNEEGGIAWNISGGRSSTGNIAVGVHDVSYVNGLSTALGYQIVDNSANTNELNVTPKTITATSFTANDKVYDGNSNAIITGGELVGVVSSGGELPIFDDVLLSTGTFDNKNAGVDKTVTLTSGSLAGADRNNYNFAVDSGVTDLATITPLALNIGLTNIIAEDKIYDRGTEAKLNATLVNFIAGDVVFLTGTGNFDSEDAGSDKIVSFSSNDFVLTGTDSLNYSRQLDFETGTTTADIFKKDLSVGGFAVNNKVYDGNPTATLVENSNIPQGVIDGDTVFFSAESATFSDPDAGIGKTVTIEGIRLSGSDVDNYQLSTGSTAKSTGSIFKALLTYLADETIRTSGETITGLTGKVIGFIPGENQANATTGDLIWSTPATENSPVGKYAILGDGLSARNYTLINDEKNFTALQLASLDPPPSRKQESTDTSVQSVNTAASAARSATDSGATGKVVDATASASSVTSSASSFGRLSLAQMSFPEMQQLIDFRREFKENLFSDAVSKLEIDPKLSDVMICTSIRKEDLNSCRITDDQRKEIKSKRIEEQQRKHRSIHKVRVASLPQIERKVIVLFGIDQYVDKTIPALQSAVSDIEAIGQLFADKLGYDEVRIVRNATRADIVRTLNELSIEMETNDSVVIYYAGHGYMNAKTGNGYWIPSDASTKDPQSWISNASISEMLANITSKQMVMISDSCYSGAFTKEQKVGLNIQNAKPDDILGKRSVVVMASGGDEPVADEGRGGHSIFAWFLMQALQNVENWKIGTNIFEQIQNDVKKSFPQVPQYGAAVSAGHQEGGDYLFEFRQLENIGN